MHVKKDNNTVQQQDLPFILLLLIQIIQIIGTWSFSFKDPSKSPATTDFSNVQNWFLGWVKTFNKSSLK